MGKSNIEGPSPMPGSYAIILPAGFGKTEYIVDYVCKQRLSTLILTHTNAGVFALRKRFSSRGVDSGYRISTIAAWCESWVRSYPSLTRYDSFADLIESEPDAYFKNLYKAMSLLAEKTWFMKTIRASYGSLVVDEYQDCTQTQHALFLRLSELLPLVVLGDPLQGVFYWIKDDAIVDWRELHFPIKDYKSRPWRWINAGCPELGEYISEIRSALMPVLDGHNVQVALDGSCESVSVVSPDRINRMQRWEGYGTVVYITSVQNVQYAFSRRHVRFQANEPVDNSTAGAICLSFDRNVGSKLALATLDFASLCFTGISQELKSYRTHLEKGSFDFRRIKKHPDVGISLKRLEDDSSCACITRVLAAIKNDASFRLHRGILFKEVNRALRMAEADGLTAVDSLERIRTQHGSYEECSPYRFLSSRTVLSKGLEYDTAIVDATGIKDARDFYVAISRCKQHLIIVSDTDTLFFPAVS